MPEDLWREAVALARREGVSSVARALGVDCGTLRERVRRTAAGGCGDAARSAVGRLRRGRGGASRWRRYGGRGGRGPDAGGRDAADGRVGARRGGGRRGVGGGAAGPRTIRITPQMRVLVALEPADFRRGMDGLARMCRAALAADPFSGTMFVFRNRRRTAAKVLVYDGQGFRLCHERLSSGRFQWWPQVGGRVTALAAHELQVLLCAGDPASTKAAPAWRPVGARS